MALLVQLVLSVEKSTFEALSYIFKLFSTLANHIVHKLIYPTKTKPQITSSYEEEKHHQEVECSRVSKDSQSGNKTEARYEHNEVLKNRKRNQIPEKTNRIIFEDSKKNENVLKNSSLLERQLYCVGDNCNSLKPVMTFFEPEAKTEEKICSTKSNKAVKQKNRLKMNTVSKYTISCMDILSTKSDNILKLLDQLNKPPLIISQQLHEDVSKDSEPHDNLHNSQNGSGETKYKNHHFPGMKLPTGTQDEENISADACYCVDTHHCLLCVDSEDDTDNITEQRLLPHEELDCDYGHAMQDELLTPEELASVETGSDDDWLYKPMQRGFIPIPA